MKFGSVCSGIEAASVAWNPLGWRASFLSEIEKFPSAVLAHHHPEIPNRGDMKLYKDWPDDAIDLLVGGTPCQSFSVAGLRQGLADPRGNLMLTYLAIARRYQPRWVVWENVPGVLSSGGGGDFGTFIRGLEECGYHAAWRVLDAQFVRVDGLGRAVPQRRRRVFVVGYLGDWRRAAAVLLEREGMQGDSPPRRQAGEGSPARSARSVAIRGRDGTPQAELGDEVANAILTPNGGRAGVGVGAILTSTGDVSHCLNAGGMGRQDYETETMVAHALRAQSQLSHREDQDNLVIAPTVTSNGDAHSGFRDEHGLVPIAYSIMPQNSGKDYKARVVDVAQPLMAGGPVGGNQGGDYIQQPVAFSENQQGAIWESDVVQALNKGGGKPGQGYAAIRQAWAVRRLTPTECERLQGFPDGYTNIPWRGKQDASDGPRYKALGNSMAVNVMRWIGRRIQMVEELTEARAA